MSECNTCLWPRAGRANFAHIRVQHFTISFMMKYCALMCGYNGVIIAFLCVHISNVELCPFVILHTLVGVGLKGRGGGFTLSNKQ